MHNIVFLKGDQIWGIKMEYELEEVERDYIEFRKEIGEEHRKELVTAFRQCGLRA